MKKLIFIAVLIITGAAPAQQGRFEEGMGAN